MIRNVVAAVAVVAILPCGLAEAQQDPGARIGSAYIPSTHTPGCSGVLCDGNDPERAAGAPPPPPCQGLICGMTPYAMRAPVTASEAQRVQEEQARAAAAPVEPPAKASRKHKSRKAKASVPKSVAARTPDPGTPSPTPK